MRYTYKMEKLKVIEVYVHLFGSIHVFMCEGVERKKFVRNKICVLNFHGLEKTLAEFWECSFCNIQRKRKEERGARDTREEERE